MRSSIVCAFAALALCQCKVDVDDGPGSSFSPGSVSAPTATGGSNAASGSGGSGGQASVGSGGGGGMGAAGMVSGGAGMKGSGGMGAAGMGSGGMGSGGMGAAGMGSGGMGSGGMGSGGMGSGGASGGDMETGKMVGMTAAHNAVRAMVDTTPPLPPMKWSAEIAEYAQEWTDMLAKTCNPEHRMTHEYGENLAAFFGIPTVSSTAQDAVDGWAGEVACWTFGIFYVTDKCDMTCSSQMHSDGCGHYTQIVWRDSVELGCGYSTCTNSQGQHTDIWICNYGPPGNIVNNKPY